MAILLVYNLHYINSRVSIVSLNFSEGDKVVESIQAAGEVFRGFESERFAQDWRYFSWSEIMMKYGAPPQVWIAFTPRVESGAPVYYDLALVYDQLGFQINYLGPAVYSETMERACPRFDEVSSIVLTLDEPRTEESDPGRFFHQLEDAVGMSVTTFYETFKHMDRDSVLQFQNVIFKFTKPWIWDFPFERQ